MQVDCQGVHDDEFLRTGSAYDLSRYRREGLMELRPGQISFKMPFHSQFFPTVELSGNSHFGATGLQAQRIAAEINGWGTVGMWGYVKFFPEGHKRILFVHLPRKGKGILILNGIENC